VRRGVRLLLKSGVCVLARGISPRRAEPDPGRGSARNRVSVRAWGCARTGVVFRRVRGWAVHTSARAEDHGSMGDEQSVETEATATPQAMRLPRWSAAGMGGRRLGKGGERGSPDVNGIVHRVPGRCTSNTQRLTLAMCGSQSAGAEFGATVRSEACAVRIRHAAAVSLCLVVLAAHNDQGPRQHTRGRDLACLRYMGPLGAYYVAREHHSARHHDSLRRHSSERGEHSWYLLREPALRTRADLDVHVDNKQERRWTRCVSAE
jgi:hypothetical protein